MEPPVAERLSLELTVTELVRVTGCKRARDQAEWIRNHYGIPAHVNSANEAIVIRAHIEALREPAETRRPVGRVR